ncbi:hypothetical protein LCM10_04005 [Rossellomorea aquimaris]|uniref:hypothetical protein n=1 Tax=Rossellomorea aquimaris TaxID=189382 RepID=UPI001CD198EE|nr:hypothetical protein [Rossellomorea aquimaris]MCA1054140.1 hypothetical protein [Rossellomorea aquimaris]
MKKGRVSILGGFILGLIISLLTLNYDGWKVIEIGVNGEVDRITNELDVNLITDSFLIMAGTGIVIYLVLSVLEKRYKGEG